MPDGVRTTDGAVRRADVIVLATGFKVEILAARLNVRGRDGRALETVWARRDLALPLDEAVALQGQTHKLLGIA